MWLVFGFALLCVPPSSARWQNSLLVQNWLPENNPLSSSKWSPAAFNTQTSLRSQSPLIPPLLTPPTNQMLERAKNMSSEMKSFRIKSSHIPGDFHRCSLGKGSTEKKRFLSGIARMMGGGGLPMPEFFGPLSRSAFLVNKKSLFLQKCQCIELLTVF